MDRCARHWQLAACDRFRGVAAEDRWRIAARHARCEQTVVRRKQPVAGRGHDDDVAGGAYTWIDDGDVQD